MFLLFWGRESYRLPLTVYKTGLWRNVTQAVSKTDRKPLQLVPKLSTKALPGAGRKPCPALPSVCPGEAGRSGLPAGPPPSPLPERDVLPAWEPWILSALKGYRAMGQCCAQLGSKDERSCKACWGEGKGASRESGRKGASHFARGGHWSWRWEQARRPDPSAVRAGGESPPVLALCFLSERLKTISQPIRRSRRDRSFLDWFFHILIRVWGVPFWIAKLHFSLPCGESRLCLSREENEAAWSANEVRK